jgi:hypothetical protein
MAQLVVEMTRDLNAQLGTVDAKNFITAFTQWQQAGGGFFHHPWFGWDNPYERPEPTDKNAGWTLYHVHLEPFKPNPTDFEDAEKGAFEAAQKTYDDWMKSKKTKQWRPTSDDVLVYARDKSPTHPRFLLIDILASPNAHKIARMENSEDKETMLAYLEVAEQYVYFSKIIM